MFATVLMQKCSVCDDDSPVIRCHECRGVSHLCALCDEEVHRWHPLHDREYWNGEYFTFIPPLLSPSHISGNLIDIGIYVYVYLV